MLLFLDKYMGKCSELQTLLKFRPDFSASFEFFPLRFYRRSLISKKGPKPGYFAEKSPLARLKTLFRPFRHLAKNHSGVWPKNGKPNYFWRFMTGRNNCFIVSEREQ
jgi:hypothetical protein